MTHNFRNRRTANQFKMMVDYMEQNPLFARRQIPKLGVRGNEKYKQMWIKLASVLNSHGPNKTASQWEKSWKNLRLDVKKKKARFLTDLRRTGNLPITSRPLNELENRVAAIFGKFGSGVSVVPELGIRHHSTTTVQRKNIVLCCKRREHEDKMAFPEEKKRDRPTDYQWMTIVGFVEDHPIMMGPTSREVVKLWETLTLILNGIPKGIVANSTSWQDRWTKFVKRVQQKRSSLPNTAEGDYIPQKDVHRRVLRLINRAQSSVVSAQPRNPDQHSASALPVAQRTVPLRNDTAQPRSSSSSAISERFQAAQPWPSMNAAIPGQFEAAGQPLPATSAAIPGRFEAAAQLLPSTSAAIPGRFEAAAQPLPSTSAAIPGRFEAAHPYSPVTSAIPGQFEAAAQPWPSTSTTIPGQFEAAQMWSLRSTAVNEKFEAHQPSSSRTASFSSKIDAAEPIYSGQPNVGNIPPFPTVEQNDKGARGSAKRKPNVTKMQSSTIPKKMRNAAFLLNMIEEPPTIDLTRPEKNNNSKVMDSIERHEQAFVEGVNSIVATINDLRIAMTEELRLVRQALEARQEANTGTAANVNIEDEDTVPFNPQTSNCETSEEQGHFTDILDNLSEEEPEEEFEEYERQNAGL